QAKSLNVSPLTTDNYWLQSMWLKCKSKDDGTVAFIPEDFVFCGGRSNEEKNHPLEYYLLDYRRRVNDILDLDLSHVSVSDDIVANLDHFKQVFTGRTPFNHQE